MLRQEIHRQCSDRWRGWPDDCGNDVAVTNIILLGPNNEYLETISVKRIEKFIMYRGFLYQIMRAGVYIQRSYLELY